ncbi:hypothetical protein ABTM39_20275, partial [Acinetobacter baumannii]
GTFVYSADASRSPVWYVSTCSYAPATGTCSTTLEQYGNGQSLSGDYRAPTRLGSVGALGVAFSSATAGTLTLPNGTAVAISRF